MHAACARAHHMNREIDTGCPPHTGAALKAAPPFFAARNTETTQLNKVNDCASCA